MSKVLVTCGGGFDRGGTPTSPLLVRATQIDASRTSRPAKPASGREAMRMENRNPR
jgi:hypothetical protein